MFSNLRNGPLNIVRTPDVIKLTVYRANKIFRYALGAIMLTYQTMISDLCKNSECKYGARCEAGECVCPTNCDGSGDEPVCASNMMTYSNECEMQKAMCQDSPSYSSSLSVVFYGDCRERFPTGNSKFKLLFHLSY